MARYQVVGLRAALELWRYCFDSAPYLFGDRLGEPAFQESSVCGPGVCASRRPNSMPQPNLLCHRE